ncbi:hypothetical protein CDIK_1095 [Cucumispora dikerogammari]|nr:hypothetical protein CDIK_1095 [Cucumispora dikerogammari]
MNPLPAKNQEYTPRRQRLSLSLREKERIINLFLLDHDIISIALITELKYRSIQTVIKKYKVSRDVSISLRGRRPGGKVLTNEIAEFVKNEIRTNCTVTLKTIQENIHAEFSITLCLETIRKCLLDSSISLKRLNCTKEAVNAPRSKELRKEYANCFLNNLTLEDKYTIFIDESPFNLSMRRNYGRSKTGTRATAVVPTNRGRNFSIIRQ